MIARFCCLSRKHITFYGTVQKRYRAFYAKRQLSMAVHYCSQSQIGKCKKRTALTNVVRQRYGNLFDMYEEITDVNPGELATAER